uniref:Aminopeptidase N n=1 Tax=Anoplophora glabripennis TaxID=217634 RepID=V5I8G3_ANOGL
MILLFMLVLVVIFMEAKMGEFKTATCFLLALTSLCSALDYRLPQTVVPTFYDLSLTIDPEETEYSGTVNISLRTSTDSDDIYIHEDGDSITIGSARTKDDEKCTFDTSDEADILKISCPTTLKQGEDNWLFMEFTGKFSEDGLGLVKSTYMDGDDKQVIIESNFKPTYARRAFPCLDEPDFKAGFAVDVTHPKDYSAISNSLISNTEDSGDDLRRTTFEATPEISTYLLTIFLSKFKAAETSSEEKVEFKIFTRPNVANLTKNVANKYYSQIIEKLDSYIGVPYEDLKDTESYLVAVPDYSDAMGDFGVFAYRETNLLDEGEKTTNRAKQNIITTMTYKLSHEWYGGDVATKWWSDVWANEAVATYLKYVISDEVDSEMELTNQFLLEVSQKMLQNDGHSFAQPLSSNKSKVNSDWEIENKLNTVNVEKGASILHMVNIILGGNENFKTALQQHLSKRKDADTDGADILKDLLETKSSETRSTSDTDYYTYLEKWAFSAGYPLVTVSLTDVNDTDTVKLSQKRFLYPTTDTETFAEETGWYVPLTATSRANYKSSIKVGTFMNPDQEMLFNFGHDQWLALNSQGGCFYRVNYDETLWRRILDGLSTSRTDFHVLQRSQMIDDIFNIARTGDVSYYLAFEMADSLVDETEYYPWYSALNAFSYLLGKIEDEDTELKLKNYILSLMENVVTIPSKNFVDDSDSHVDVLKNVLVLKWACELGHEECIKYATETFKSFKESSSLDDYNAREVIFCNGIRHSENVKEDWEFLWKIYTNSLSVHEQNDILNALGCAEDKELLLSYLQKVITTDSGIKRQDAVTVFKSVLSSSVGLEAVKEYLKTNVSAIQNFFKDMRILAEMVYALGEKLISDEDVEWLTDLLTDEILNDYEDVRTKANALASVNNYWLANFQSEITDIFAEQSTTEASSTESSSTEASSTESSSTESSSTESSSTESSSTGSPATGPSSPVSSSTESSPTELPSTGSSFIDSSSTQPPTSTEWSTNTEESTSSEPATSTEVPTTTESKSNRVLSSTYILLCVAIFAMLS